ncbi:nuclear transport factor 2 family protein [Mucilaginibacter sp. HMF5004]|uniref:nuclear transport factor 2 family protein n=1 Tax=Mucilaginibacter rivuli TaxID=2857527 RepID=UPI001C5D39CB|nr:nuclear transport factor 2 family protein [Mucilaginibacter rivuli]MBW4888156.1 nuclear transport factor 2 family protein [Mucilaginibacter rivuli]
MKNAVTLTMALVMLIFSNTQARKATTDDMLTINYDLNTYLNAVGRGRIEGLSKILADDLKCTIKYTGKSYIVGKEELLKYYKSVENIAQECLINTSVINKTPDVTIARIEMKYSTFKRINFVTMVNSEKGWKITNIYSDTVQKGYKE